ncbi:cell wall-active antibiotics response protein LiaF [Paenibacillus segetis]|uniref:Lia operon protein LiaF n=1 Tax=Paenibacillus segetis TaxID=1325360 RepID=A0ABQ1Y662_9BACL|nr:cell wall-active antibiotics response protein LiaF [Paenibacillus segetis]GGH14051.1 hypothetical protein GCM10008013_07500 [Paenibacillus segetis]
MRDGRFFGGMVLIGIGALFLLNQMGITDISIGYLFSTYWPVFLILGGLSHLFNGQRGGSNLIGSAILIIIGVYFLSRNTGYVVVSPGEFFKYFFPVMLIIGGLHVLFKPRSHRRERREERREERHRDRHNRHRDRNNNWNVEFPPPAPMNPPVPPITEMESPLDSIFGDVGKEESKKQEKSNQDKFKQDYYGMGGASTGKVDVLNKSGFIGDVHFGQEYFQLQPTNISHFIGDTIIDLTKAQIPYGETKINVSAFIGDVKVFIPDDMDIGITVTSSAFIGDLKVLTQNQGGFMSSVQAQSPYYGEAGKKVKLIVSVFIGDVKVNMVG